jgi:hypothetical protein
MQCDHIHIGVNEVVPKCSKLINQMAYCSLVRGGRVRVRFYVQRGIGSLLQEQNIYYYQAHPCPMRRGLSLLKQNVSKSGPDALYGVKNLTYSQKKTLRQRPIGPGFIKHLQSALSFCTLYAGGIIGIIREV